jgi:hypothetical protein
MPKIHRYGRENCAVRSLHDMVAQIIFTYRVFNEDEICVMSVRISVTQRNQQSIGYLQNQNRLKSNLIERGNFLDISIEENYEGKLLANL